MALYHLAKTCRGQGHMDLWRLAVQHALRMPHHSYQEIYQRGNVKLLLSDWSGWIDREARIHDPVVNYLESRELREIRFNIRAWDGQENIDDQSLLLVSEGTLGDCLQMLRYIPAVAAQCGKLTLMVQPEVAPLVRRAYGRQISVILPGTLGLGYDRYAWLTSLPALIDKPPAFTRLPGVESTRPSEAVGGLPLDVGICWASDPDCLDQDSRSVPPQLLASLFAREDLRWWSLQTGVGAADLSANDRVRPPAAPLYTFAQMAQMIARLDAVVTVDAAVAHLSGLLEIPTYVLLCADADARWALDQTTEWYPTMRFTRQDRTDCWDDALAVLHQQLETYTRQIATV
jgi:hypothetical protein